MQYNKMYVLNDVNLNAYYHNKLNVNAVHICPPVQYTTIENYIYLI